MSTFTRTINIRSSDLGKNVVLVLIFDESVPYMFQGDIFPTAWKVTGFGASGAYNLQATYKSQLGFSRPEIQRDNIVNVSTWVALNPGQKTNLTKRMEGEVPIYSFSPPEVAVNLDEAIIAFNRSQGIEAIGVGFFPKSPEFSPETVVIFDNMGHNENATVEFAPILSAYIVMGYEQDKIIRSKIRSDVIWQENLAQLRTETYWLLQRSPVNGEFTIIADTLKYPHTDESE